ncbi:MAG: hypothetical protein GTO00_02415, partial [Deltaproteobacteria bacterium]|nr:hypothetical protein [Deltaproteobacteria bacterium]
MKKLRIWFSLLLPVFFCISLIGCGTYTGIESGGNSTGSTILSGRASKGPISGAQIEIFALNGDGALGDLIGAAVTDGEGRYSSNLGAYTGPVLIAVTGGQYSDEASGLTVQNEIVLHAAIPEASGRVSAMVSPLTEIAYRTAGALTPENIGNANASISTIFGIDILSTEPIDPSDATEAADASQAQKDYGLLLAAISALSRSTGLSTSSTGVNVSSVLDDLEADVSDGELDSMGTQLLSGLASFLGSGNNNTGILDLDGTGLDEAIITGGISYSGVWYETDGDSGEFTTSFTQTDTSFDGTYFVVKHTGEGGTYIYSLSGSRSENSYRGTDSRGREFILDLRQHPLGTADNLLVGSYFDPSGGERGSMRSTNN